MLAIHAQVGTVRGELLCEIGNSMAGRAKELRAMLDAATEPPRAVAERSLVCLEWCARFIIERGLVEWNTDRLPRA